MREYFLYLWSVLKSHLPLHFMCCSTYLRVVSDKQCQLYHYLQCGCTPHAFVEYVTLSYTFGVLTGGCGYLDLRVVVRTRSTIRIRGITLSGNEINVRILTVNIT